MKKNIITSTIVVVFSLISCLVSTYMWIDRSISLDYMTQSYESERESVRNLQKLLTFEWGGDAGEYFAKKIR